MLFPPATTGLQDTFEIPAKSASFKISTSIPHIQFERGWSCVRIPTRMSPFLSSEKNKHLGVTITRAGTINPVDYPSYPPELKLHEYEDNEEDVFCNAPTASSLPAGCKLYNQVDYFRQIIRAYQGRDEDAVKYVKKVKALIDKPLDEAR